MGLGFSQMRIAKPILMAVLAVALAAYAFDCSAMATPEQAMQCCSSMPCASHGHRGQDCCKTMQIAHVPFTQPASAQRISFNPATLAILPASGEAHVLDSSVGSVAAHCHAPPGTRSLNQSPLRI
jgi:hypothetical protein